MLYTFRTPSALRAALIFSTLAVLSSPQPRAQTAAPRRIVTPTRAPSAASQTSKNKSAARQLKQRRAQAVAALHEAADAARDLDDLNDRAELLTLAADALWPFDEQSARAIFRGAWAAAKEADRAEGEEAQGASVAPRNERFTFARQQLLSRLAARDPRQAEIFLSELLADVKAEDEQSALDGAAYRFSLAGELVARGEYASAAEIAAPAIREGMSSRLAGFILELRGKEAGVADALYMRLLQHLSTRTHELDANAILLLSSYVVSPRVLVTLDKSGSANYQVLGPEWDSRDAAAASPAPDVRAKFYEVAALALAARAQAAAADSSPSAKLSTYFVLERLLPFFEREAPARAPQMRAHLDALANDIEASRRETLTKQSGFTPLSQHNPTDPLQHFADFVASAPNAQSRDTIRLMAVQTASPQRAWQRALTFAREIESEELRRACLTFIAVSQIANLANSYSAKTLDDYERAASFTAAADVPTFARAWGHAQAALLASKRGKAERAAELLDEAARYAQATDAGTRGRVAAHVYVAKIAAETKSPRAWESLRAVVGAVNSSEDSMDDEEPLAVAAVPPPFDTGVASLGVDASPFRLDGLFATMAKLDFTRTLQEARTLKDEFTRTRAIIAASRAALEAEAVGGGRQAR